MSHEIANAQIARARNLRNNDGSQFDTIRLVVQRSGTHVVTCSLILERIGAKRIEGSRLAFATFDARDVEPGPWYHQRLLLAAVQRMR
jgi:hypothetical protein